jgi:hypothetical protein
MRSARPLHPAPSWACRVASRSRHPSPQHGRWEARPRLREPVGLLPESSCWIDVQNLDGRLNDFKQLDWTRQNRRQLPLVRRVKTMSQTRPGCSPTRPGKPAKFHHPSQLHDERSPTNHPVPVLLQAGWLHWPCHRRRVRQATQRPGSCLRHRSRSLPSTSHDPCDAWHCQRLDHYAFAGRGAGHQIPQQEPAGTTQRCGSKPRERPRNSRSRVSNVASGKPYSLPFCPRPKAARGLSHRRHAGANLLQMEHSAWKPDWDGGGLA